VQHQAMIATIKEFDQRDSSNKRWTTRKGMSRGALPFTKVNLHSLLTKTEKRPEPFDRLFASEPEDSRPITAGG